MEALIIEQHFHFNNISRAVENCKKIGKKNFTVATLRGRLSQLQQHWDQAQQLHCKIETSASAEDRTGRPYFAKDEYLEAEDAFFGALDFFNEWIAKLTPAIHSVSTSDRDQSIVQGHTPVAIQLPRISIPRFSGEYVEWENFRDLFESLVINNESLSNVQRLHYLKGSLFGEAELLLKNVSVTDVNYESAWQALVDRYDNRRVLITSYLHAINNIPSSKSESVHELKRIRDGTTDALNALRNLKRPVDSWDDLLVFYAVQKLDPKSRCEWEIKLGDTVEYPTFKQLVEFLSGKIRALEAINSSFPQPSTSTSSQPRRLGNTRSHVSTASVPKCFACAAAHGLTQCPTFRSFSVEQRVALLRDQRCCFNCMRVGHFPSNCPSQYRCNRCQRRHHTMIHTTDSLKADFRTQTSGSNVSSRKPGLNPLAKKYVPDNCENFALDARQSLSGPHGRESAMRSDHDVSGYQDQVSCLATGIQRSVLLATAWVRVTTPEGRSARIRALIDPGSESTFITESLAQTLRMQRRKAQVRITGVGGASIGVAKFTTEFFMASCIRDESAIPASALILNHLTSYKPSRILDSKSLRFVKDLELADHDPTSNDPIDLLIGADLYGDILREGLRRGNATTPTAQRTMFGWVLSGPIVAPAQPEFATTTVLHCAVTPPLDILLRKFWETEEISAVLPLTEMERQCEAHFASTHRRNADGRYVVRLPFKAAPPIDIGYSLSKATLLFNKLEQRLSRSPPQLQAYNDFLSEYAHSGHMAPAPLTARTSQAVYLPHHGVIKADSSTTRLRVVFNASSVTSNGTTLNEHLLTGPKLQNDLPSIINRWRRYRFVYTADIAQMFRQILVDERDTDYQRILWRPHPNRPVQAYRLLTVTYGTACAPYLAIRVLKQLAQDEGYRFPLAVRILEQDMYVDDALFGGHEFGAIKETRTQLSALLESGGFHLRKWSSNHPDLLAEIPPADQTANPILNLNEVQSVKVLGLVWNPLLDSFAFKVTVPAQEVSTKRQVLSTIARIFDPLGWVAPVVIAAKILMQELWLYKEGWDDLLPQELQARWTSYSQELTALHELSIPRWTGQTSDRPTCELHGFADASQRAYAAVVYLRLSLPEGIRVTLVQSKTKVAPIKTLSIPRLELNALVLLARLIRSTQATLDLSATPVYGWTDSTVVLDWLRQHPIKLKTFVANRIAEIQTSLPQTIWGHVKSQENPADCASRGIPAPELLSHPLWWSGPPWLTQDSSTWPKRTSWPDHQTVEEEKRAEVLTHLAQAASSDWDLAHRISDWPRLVRITAYCRQFIKRCRKQQPRIISLPALTLTGDEIREAESFWFHNMQASEFSADLATLKQKGSVSAKSPLVKLSPFLDESGLIRVGGRLRHSALPYDETFPIVLPKHRVSRLITEHAHWKSFHGGPQLMLRVLRQRYWILGARNVARSVVQRCIACVRERAQPSKQIMGDLPTARVTPTRPFLHSGLDYAGPVHVLPIAGRGQRARKAYIAIFVCMSTRAIHLELAVDYSTAAFLAAFRRFVARRGLPNAMYSDNGTNFQGADKELTQAFRTVARDRELRSVLISDAVDWHFIPPAAPHFGGLWEAGVRSVKHHLRRVVGSRTLTVDEFMTLLTQVEACLNSRPIAPLTSDPNDVAALTPGHFLIGAPLITVPDRSTLDLRETRLSRWQQVRRALEQFWRCWSQDYLHSLQQRTKWTTEKPSVAINDLVLVCNNLLPPSK